MMEIYRTGKIRGDLTLIRETEVQDFSSIAISGITKMYAEFEIEKNGRKTLTRFALLPVDERGDILFKTYIEHDDIS
jgi:hypothetical protein